jgi:hypothetical protein
MGFLHQFFNEMKINKNYLNFITSFACNIQANGPFVHNDNTYSRFVLFDSKIWTKMVKMMVENVQIFIILVGFFNFPNSIVVVTTSLSILSF